MTARPNLRALPGYVEHEPDVLFCGHCGRSPGYIDIAPASRVCPTCELGLLVGASPSLAPAPDEPFVMVDNTLSVCAVSLLAEDLLGARETDAVNHHVTELLLPADCEVGGPETLVNLVLHAARGETDTSQVVLRPAMEFGIRFWARIGPCGPPRAALLVLADGRS
jgi:hypothetical protein